MGPGYCMHPQDPAKARWLAGSGALLSGLLLFLLLPPLLFCHMEGWSYVESFYFAFITLSTVGFGDYVIGERPLQAAGGRLGTQLPGLHSPAPFAGTCRAPGPGGGGGALGGPESRGHSPGKVQPALLCDGAKVTQVKSDDWNLNPALGAGYKSQSWFS